MHFWLIRGRLQQYHYLTSESNTGHMAYFALAQIVELLAVGIKSGPHASPIQIDGLCHSTIYKVSYLNEFNTTSSANHDYNVQFVVDAIDVSASW